MHFYEKQKSHIHQSAISWKEMIVKFASVLKKYGEPSDDTKHQYILIGNNINSADIHPLDHERSTTTLKWRNFQC
jgi:hypothetical protein